MANSKPVYDLEERTFQFAKRVRLFIKKLPKTIANIEDSKQIVRASGSVGSNYIEANESLSKKDFLMSLKSARNLSATNLDFFMTNFMFLILIFRNIP